jgi:small-conductance mechanosensitive channel
MDMHKKCLPILLLGAVHVLSGMQFLPSSLKDSSKAEAALPFLSGVEMRKKQIVELEARLTELKKRVEEQSQECSSALAQIQIDGAEIQKIGARASEKEIEYLNKKIATFNARRQNLINIQEIGKTTVSIAEKRIELQKEFLNYLQTEIAKRDQTPKQQLKPIYSWKEFRDAQIKMSEQIAQIDAERLKKENIKKQILAEKETLLSLQRQLDNKGAELGKIINKKGINESEEDLPKEIIKLEAEAVDQEISLLREKIKYSNQKIEQLTEEEKLKEGEIEYLQIRLSEYKNILAAMEERLLFDSRDVELAKFELKKETQLAIDTKNELNRLRDPKKAEREQLNIEHSSLLDKLKQLTSGDKKDISSINLTKSELQRVEALITFIDKELLLIDAKKDVADLKLKIKEIQFKMLELRYRLKTEKLSIRELLSSYKNQRDLETSLLKSFKEKRIEAVNLLVETQREISAIDLKMEKVQKSKGHQDLVFVGKITENIGQTKRILSDLSLLTQDFLAVCSDLIHQQASLLNYYELILADLEKYQTTQSIWKRTPTAISLESLEVSLIESEDFSQKLFWETPAYMWPLSIFNFIKAFSVVDFLIVLLFLTFSIGLFFLSKKWLVKIREKLSYKSQGQLDQQKQLTYTILYTLVNFWVKHFNLIFTLIAIYVYTGIEYNFISSRFLSLAYYNTLFYLICIPFLIYLSTQLLTELKELNKKLSFIFFAETIQERFLILLSAFLYVTSTIIPFRSALLLYSNTSVNLGNVLMAGYSLILLFIVLFFFSKEDIFKVIPYTQYSIIEWFKKKIEKFYYLIFFFLLGLLILRNPYVGYSNLAWYLTFAVPATWALLWLLFIVHNYIRTYALFLFMIEDEDEIKDRFEHAKTYYGILVVGSFLVLLFIDIFFIAHIWGFVYSPTEIWRLFAETWTIPLGPENKLGFVQFLIVATFIFSGFLISSLLDKFILNKLFEILRVEPGTQNTFSKIMHYTIVSIAVILGFLSIHLEQFIYLISGLLGIGLGFALKDIIADFVAGFFVLIERPVEIGNYIQVDGLEGTVHKISARTTTIVNSRNFAIFIPNKDLLAKQVTNWSHRKFAMGFEIYIRVTHEADPDLVRRVIIETLQSHPAILKLPSVIARLDDIEDNAFYFLSRAFISTQRLKESWAIAAELRIKLIKAFRENGIKFAKPQRVVYIDEQTNQTRVEEKKPLGIKFDK